MKTPRKISSNPKQDLRDIIMQPSKYAPEPPVATPWGHRYAGLARVFPPTQGLARDPASDIICNGSDHAATRTGFLDLPYEIREMIYQLALVACSNPTYIDPAHMEAIWSARQSFRKEFIYVPLPCYAYQTLHRLDLLAVSGLIHDEAAPIFYGQNTFSLPPCIDPGEASKWKTYAHLFRKVVVRFPSYGLVCGPPRSHARNNCDEDDKVTDMTVALSLHNKCKGQEFDKVDPAAVEPWERTKEMLALMVNVESVHLRIEGGQDVWGDPWASTPLVDVYELPRRVVPYLKDWSEFMFGDTCSSTRLSKPRPELSAEIDFRRSARKTVAVRILNRVPNTITWWSTRTSRRVAGNSG